MKQLCSAVVVVILLVALSAIAVVNASDNWDKDIWNRYRHELIKYFSPRYCSEVGQSYQSNQCKNMDVTVFQFVDEPKDALWESSNFFLNEDVCKFTPAWSTSFSPKCAGVDCSFEQTYKKALMTFKANATLAAKTFLSFTRSPRDKFDKAPSSLPWREVNQNHLKNFVKVISTAPATTTQFSINVDRNVPVTFHHNPWGLKVPIYAQQTPFMRSISINEAKNKIKSDDEGLSEFLFRRRRAPPPPVVARPVQIIKSNTFKVTFSAKGLTSVTVKPGEWFDKDFIEKNKHQLQGVLGPKGSMPLMPETFYVAYQPRVEMVISESQLGMVKKDLDNKNVYAFLIGGSHFSKYNAIPMSDSEVEEFAANKDKFAGDEITWTPLSDEEEAELADSVAEASRQQVKVEEYKDKRSELLRGNHQADGSDEESVEETARTESDAEETVASDWFWRRRRHNPPPPRPPPPPPPKVERNFRIVFQSNSPTPQILAVVSRIIAADAFDCEGYLSRYQDLRLKFYDDCAKARDHFFANGANEGRSCAEAEDPSRAKRMKFDCYSVLGRHENYKRAFGSDCAAAKKQYFEKDFDNLAIDASYEAGAHNAFAALLKDFNCRYYLAANADVARATGNNCDKAKAHYQNNGIKEGRKGSAQFDCYSYLIRYGDLLKAFGDNCQRAEQHWYGNGIREKRSADFDATLHNKLSQFNCQSYMNRYADVKKAVRSNCQGAKNHYLVHGIKEGRIGN